jgi:RNA polymerase sigma-54 factor
VSQLTGLLLAPALALRATPALVNFTQLLALSVGDLQGVIEQQLNENPALDRVEHQGCIVCGQTLDGRRCRICTGGVRAVGSSAGQTPVDSMQVLAERRTVGERLLAEVAPMLGSAGRVIAEYVIADLDGRGLLDRDASELGRDLGVESSAVSEVIEVIQSVGPPGICARDLTECLLLQVDDWERRGRAPSLLRPLVAGHLEDLARGRLGTIARALDATQAEVAAAREFLRSNLRPFVTFSAPPDQVVPSLVPDVILRARPEDPDRFEVDVVDRFGVRVDPAFVTLARQSGEHRGLLTDDERRQVVQQVARARMFLSGLGDRSATLRAVAEQVVERQRKFVRDGRRGQVPLTRADIARDLGIHESTVSRAIRDKHVQLPAGHVVPFADFFGSAQSVHDCLRAIVAAEGRPLSDAELAGELGARGHRVARRTVAKYRAQLGIARQPVR